MTSYVLVRDNFPQEDLFNNLNRTSYEIVNVPSSIGLMPKIGCRTHQLLIYDPVMSEDSGDLFLDPLTPLVLRNCKKRGLPVILTSVYGEERLQGEVFNENSPFVENDETRIVPEDYSRFIDKPYRIEDLLMVLREVKVENFL